MRASIAFSVAPSRPISSSAGPTGRRPLGSADPGGLAAHALDRAQRGGGRAVAGQRREHEHDRQADHEQDHQRLQGVVAIVDRGADDKRARRVESRPDHAHGLPEVGKLIRGADHAREVLLVVGRQRPAAPRCRQQVDGAGVQALVDRRVQLGGEARVERHAGRREQDRHHARERERHAQANGHGSHRTADASAHRPR